MNKLGGQLTIPIEVSARHIHLSEADFRELFGEEPIAVKRKLSQPGQFSAEQTVTVRGPQGEIGNVRLVGPLRDETQIELAVSDCRKLGIDPHFALSGMLNGSPGAFLIGPTGSVALGRGAIVALAHLHMDPSEASSFGLVHLDHVTVTIRGARTVSLHNVVVRAREGVDKLSLHIDIDEANTIGSLENASIISLEKSACGSGCI